MLDAGPIIKLFSLDIWDKFIEHCSVTVSRTIAYHEALYTEDGTRQIDLKPYEERCLIKILDLEPSIVKSFHDTFDQLYKADIHPGEKETLAFLCNSSEKGLVCSGDKAVFRVIGLLGRVEQGISLEEILQKIGLSLPGQLERQYTKGFREKWTRIGQVDSLQGRGLQ
ncbi:MAG: hypothetical protein A2Z25_00190 [Planctomycetes bacterium RBG_16_55_9]|nr:MAG: hypothetical protein A2Z25_00190 [Planctomycetes bacterium RBG_16_55_9]